MQNGILHHDVTAGVWVNNNKGFSWMFFRQRWQRLETLIPGSRLNTEYPVYLLLVKCIITMLEFSIKAVDNNINVVIVKS